MNSPFFSRMFRQRLPVTVTGSQQPSPPEPMTRGSPCAGESIPQTSPCAQGTERGAETGKPGIGNAGRGRERRRRREPSSLMRAAAEGAGCSSTEQAGPEFRVSFRGRLGDRVGARWNQVPGQPGGSGSGSRRTPGHGESRKSRRLRKSRKSASGSRPPVTPGSRRTATNRAGPKRTGPDRTGAARPAACPGVGSFRARCGPAVAHGRKRVSDSPRTRKAASSTTDRRLRTGPGFRFFQPQNALATALPQSPDLLL